MYDLIPGARQAQYGAIPAPAAPAQTRCSKCSRRECGCKGYGKGNRPQPARKQVNADTVTSTVTYSQTPSHTLRARSEPEKTDCNILLMQRLVTLLEQQQTTQIQQTIPNIDAPNCVYENAALLQNMAVATGGDTFSLPYHDMVQQATNQPGSEISQLSQYGAGWIPESSYQHPLNVSPVVTFSNGYIAQNGGDNYPDMTTLAYQANINGLAAIQQPMGALETVDDPHGLGLSYDVTDD